MLDMPRKISTRESIRSGHWLTLVCVLWPFATAWGIGLGNLHIQTALGEPLRAMVRLVGDEDVAGVHCFQLTPATSRDLLDASPRMTLRQRGNRYELILESSRPIKEPTLEIGLRMLGCGVDLERNYVALLDPRSLLPGPVPVPVETTPVTPPTASPGRPARQATLPASPRPAASRPARAPVRVPPAVAMAPEAVTAPASPAMRTPQPAPVESQESGPESPAPAPTETLKPPEPEPRTVSETPPPTEQPPIWEHPAWPPLWLLAGGLLSIFTVLFFLWRARQHRRAQTRQQLMRASVWKAEMWLDADPTQSSPSDEVPPRSSGIGVQLEKLDPKEMTRSFGVSPKPETEGDSGDDDYQQTMELTEVMLAYGRVQEAAHNLRAHLEKYPQRSLESWLMLMKLYLQAEDRASFDAAGGALRANFNAAPPGWEELEETAADTATQSLLDMPHILAHLSREWGQPGANEYLEHLLRDNRGGQRQGFPLSIIREILLLREILKQREAH